MPGRVSAACWSTLLLTLLTSNAVGAEDDFFPIGLFEAGVFPKEWRYRQDIWPACTSSNPDTTIDAPEWSSLDEAGGDRLAGDALGYTSGFNVVQDFFYRGEAGEISRWDVNRYLRAAEQRDFKVLVVLPALENPYLDLDERQHFYQRTPPVFSHGDTLIQTFLADTTVYGWYLVDEPIDVTTDRSAAPGLGGGFHTNAVSALKLKAAFEHFKSIDSSRPFIVTLPDYNASDFGDTHWGPRGVDDFWRWDNDSKHAVPDTFPDPGGHGAPPIVMTQNYDASADIIQNDTYVNAAYGVPHELDKWVQRLRQYDEILEGRPGGVQAVISCALGCMASVQDSCKTEGTSGCARFSYSHLRFKAFSAIVHGASGIWFWSYSHTYDSCGHDDPCVRHAEPDTYFVNQLVPLSNDLAGVQNYLSGETVGTYLWGDTSGTMPTLSTPALHSILKQRDNSYILIVANTSNQPQVVEADFSAFPMTGPAGVFNKTLVVRKRLPSSGEVSFLPVSDGRFSDLLAAWDVQIYEFRPGAVIGALSDFLELESALQTASIGDTVLVDPRPNGLPYEGSLQLPAGVLILGTPGLTRPKLDAGGSQSAVTCSVLSGLEAAIQNFELRGFMNAGISIDSTANGSLRVENCVIEIDSNAGSSATGIDGSAAAFSGRQLTVRSTRIESSRTSGSLVGIRWAHASQSESVDVVIEDCTIVQNPPLDTGIGVVIGSASGHHRLVGNTISGFGTGISATLGNYQTWYSATGLLERNVLVGNGVGASLIGNIPSRRNIAWNLSDDYLPSSVGDSSLVADPRLCDSTLSLNATSPCLPANNPWNVWVGSSREVACASGVLGTDYSTRLLTLDRTAVPSGRLNLTSDLNVAAGRSLSLTGDIAVVADSLDEANNGLYSQGNEIVVEGTLTVTGSSEAPATFRSGVSSPSAGSWGGFYVKNGGDLRLNNVDLRHGTYGVLAVGLADTVSLVETFIDSCQQMLVSVNNACLPTACPTTNVTITGGEFRMRTATHGIHLLKPESVVIDGASVIGTSSGFYGIFADTAGTSTQALIQNCVVEDLSTGTGIYINADSPSLKSNRVIDCKWGIQLRGSGTPEISRVSNQGPGTQLIRCTTGLYVQSTSASVDSVSVKPGGVSGATGVQNSGNSGGAYTKLHVVGGNVAFNATSTASPAPTLRGSRFIDFAVNGTKHNGTGGLDLGTSSSEGLNRIESSSASGKWVSVKTCPSGGATLPARSNYWGGTPDPADFSSCVDYADWLSTDPTQPSAVQLSVEAVPPRPFQATPNPFTGGVRLGFSVERPGPIQVRIFDVAGRLVRSVVESDLAAGSYERDWDGRDEEGQSTPAGIYFARLIEPGRVRAIKLVRLP